MDQPAKVGFDGELFTIVPWPFWRFAPLSDITAYELAIIMARVPGLPVFQESLVSRWKLADVLDAALLRHFVKVET